MIVLYYFTKEEKKECGRYNPIPSIVLKVCKYGLFDLMVPCPEGKTFTARNVAIKANDEDLGVWDYTDQYKNDYRNLNN